MSTARFLAAAVAIYGIAISAGVVLYLIFRDSLEDLRAKLQQRLADRHESVQSTRARSVQFGAPQVWESAAVGGGPVFLRGLRQRLTPVPSRLAWAVLAVVALAAAAVVGATHDFGSSSATGPRASAQAAGRTLEHQPAVALAARSREPVRSAPRNRVRDTHLRRGALRHSTRRSCRTCNRCPSTRRRWSARRSRPQGRRAAVLRRSGLPRVGRLRLR